MRRAMGSFLLSLERDLSGSTFGPTPAKETVSQ